MRVSERGYFIGLKFSSCFLEDPPTMCKKKKSLKSLKDFKIELDAYQDAEEHAVLL